MLHHTLDGLFQLQQQLQEIDPYLLKQRPRVKSSTRITSKHPEEKAIIAKKSIFLMTIKRFLNLLRSRSLHLNQIGYVLVKDVPLGHTGFEFQQILNEYRERENFKQIRWILTTSVVFSDVKLYTPLNEIEEKINSLKHDLNAVVLRLDPEDNIKLQIELKPFSDSSPPYSKDSSHTQTGVHKWISNLTDCARDLGKYGIRKRINWIYNFMEQEKTLFDKMERDHLSINYESIQRKFQRLRATIKEYEGNLPCELLQEESVPKASILTYLAPSFQELVRTVDLCMERYAQGNGIIVVRSKAIGLVMAEILNELEIPVSITLVLGRYHKRPYSFQEGRHLIITTRNTLVNVYLPHCQFVIDFNAFRFIDEYLMAMGKMDRASGTLPCVYSFSKLHHNVEKFEDSLKAYEDTLFPKLLEVDTKTQDEALEMPEVQPQVDSTPTLSPLMAADIFNRYVNMLPSGHYLKEKARCEYRRSGTRVLCKIHLPKIAAIQSIVSDLAPSHREAKRNCVMKVVNLLISRCLVNRHYEPIISVNRTYIENVSKKDRHDAILHSPSVICSQYTPSTEHEIGINCFIYKIIFNHDDFKDQDDINLGLILPVKLREKVKVPVPTESFIDFTANVSFVKCMDILPNELETIKRIHAWLVYELFPNGKSVVNPMKQFHKKYFMCFLDKDSHIHWDKIDVLLNIKDRFDTFDTVKLQKNDLETKTSMQNVYMIHPSELTPSAFTGTVTRSSNVHILAEAKRKAPYVNLIQRRKIIYTKNLSEHYASFFIYPLSAYIYNCISFLPRVLFTLERHAFAQDLVDAIGVPLPTQLALECISSKSCLEEYSYESLEFLGDCYYKLVCCEYMFDKYPSQHLLNLDTIKSYLITNTALYRHAKNLELATYIQNNPFKPEEWHPPGFETTDAYPTQVSTKVLADVIEAFIGAYFMHGGRKASNSFLRAIGADDLFDAHPYTYPAFQERYIRFLELEESIGYSFNSRQLLIDALSIKTDPDYPSIFTSQRTTMLGDGLLDHFVVFDLLSSKVHLNPGELTLLRSCLVNSNLRACFAVSLKLHKYILHNDSDLAKHIEEFIDNFHLTDSLTFEELACIDVPPYLGEVFLSVMAAIYIDSGKNLSTVQTIFKPVITVWMDKYIRDASMLPQVPSLSIRKQKDKLIDSNKIKLDIQCKRLRCIPYYYTEAQINGKAIGSGILKNEKAAKNLAAFRGTKEVEKMVEEEKKRIQGKV